MAEVLIGVEWLAVEESAQAVEDMLLENAARIAPPEVPLLRQIRLTEPAQPGGGSLGSEGASVTLGHHRRSLWVAVSAIHGVREPLDG